MKWNEFKNKVELLGVKDNDDISWITIITDNNGNVDIKAEKVNEEWEIEQID